MLNQKDLNYFKFGKVENIKFWNRLGGKPNLSGKTILDFGCGHGALCIDIADSGAKSVLGIDLSDNLLNFANLNLDKNFDYLKDKVFFKKKDILKDNFEKKFDLIVSKDTFEHTLKLPEVLKRFHDLLSENGRAYIGFGPLYNAYNGDHGRTQLNIPWLHTILPEKLIIKRYNKNNHSQIEKIEDLGLSKYSFKEYKSIFENSNFSIEYFETNKSDHPVSKIFNFFSNFKLFKEYFTYNIYCILRKV